MLPAEKTHYRKGLALGLTLAETFSIVVFILLLACAVLLRQEQRQRDTAQAQRDTAQAQRDTAQAQRDTAQAQRDTAQAQRDTARIDLSITQEMLRADSISWGNADAWFDYARRLRQELEAEQVRAETTERDLVRERARASEAEALLAARASNDDLAERTLEQAAELDALKDSVSGSERRFNEVTSRLDSLETRLAEAEQIGRLVRDGIAERRDLSPEQAWEVVEQAAHAERLADSLSGARRTIGAMDRELREVQQLLHGDTAAAVDSLRTSLSDSRFREDTLRGRIRDAERERDDAIGRAEYRETQLQQLRQGSGIDPPPCWLDGEGSPEYIFRIELLDRGMRLFNIAPERRVNSDPEAMRYAASIEDGRIYAPAEFLRLALPFYSMGTARTEAFGPMGCRFWIRPVDLTGDRKDIFQERQEQLWRRFWFRW